MAYYWLTPPSRAIFILSVLLAVLALLVRYAHFDIPVVSHYTFETLLAGFLLLLAGNLFKGF
jgi:predicted tellurium resistance membrane protein TerC